MKTKMVNLSFPENMLSDIDKVAKQEYRSRSELVREAVRRYILRKQLDAAYAYGARKAKEAGITPENLNEAIADVRAQMRKER